MNGHQPKAAKRFDPDKLVPPPGGTGVQPPPPKEVVMVLRYEPAQVPIDDPCHSQR